jgi:hypothetical protein
VRLIRSRIAVALVTGAIAIGASGCWLAALQLAPAALQLVEGAGVGVAKLSQGEEAPKLGMIELRKDATGAPQYRDLGIDDSSGELKWIPVTSADTGPDGWRPAVNFTKMDFRPPLAPAIPARGTRYLAYAPQEAQSKAEQEGIDSFGDFFGDPVGTFRWNGRIYNYWLPEELPRVEERI